MHQTIQHQMRNVTHVPAILKLAEILRKMLPADMDMRSGNPALEVRPEAFDGVHASAGLRGIFAARMVDGDVDVAAMRKVIVPSKFVGVDRIWRVQRPCA